MRRIAIVGAGVAGLSAAVYLEEARRRGELTYSIYESTGRAGGSLQTEVLEGCIIEGGADSFLTSKTAVLEICKLLGTEKTLVPSNDAMRKTYILVRGRLIPMPPGMALMVPTGILDTLKSRLFSVATKIQIIREFLGSYIPPPQHEFESVSAFVERHFGREMATRVAAPLLAGVYGGDAEKLSARAVIPTLVEMERQHGSLGRHLYRARKAATTPQPIFTGFQCGMKQFIEAMVNYLDPCSIRLEDTVKSAMRERQQWRVISTRNTAEYFDHLIVAAPAAVAAIILGRQSPPLGDELRRISYSSSFTVALGYNADQLAVPRGFGFLVPKEEGRRMMACTFVHDKFPGRVPDGTKLLRVFFSGDQNPDLISAPDEEIVRVAREELQQILGIDASPKFSLVHRWKKSMPQYEVGHPELVLRIKDLTERLGNLSLIGNAYHGIGVPDCVRGGKRAADEVLAAVNA